MDKEALKKLSDNSSIKIDDSLFTGKTGQEDIITSDDDAVDRLEEERLVREEFESLSRVETFEQRMKRLKITKDDIFDMVMQLSDDGYIEEDVSILNGKITAVFRTSKMKDSREFVETFDKMNINTRVKTEYYINLFALASVLVQYKNEDLSEMSIIERIRWIEDNLASPIYKILLDRSSIFLEKVELLSSEEVADFF